MSIELRHGPQHDAVNCLCRARRRHVAHTDRCPRAGGALDRRAWLARASGGILGAALATLLQDDRKAQAAAADLRPRAPHFQPRAHAVIQLFMNGGPSQMDLFDPKPELDRRHGEAYFDRIAGEVENASAAGAIMRSPFRFAQHGESGAWLSELLPHTARVVDELAFIRSMYTDNLTHEPALWIIHSGRMLPGQPTLGAWVTYALGSENQNLPAYVVLDDPQGLPVNGVQNWQAGYLPPVFQGTRFRAVGSPVLNLHPQFDEPPEATALERELLAALDRRHRDARPGQPALDGRLASYELAGRMQLAASDALDLSGETQATLEAYGIGREPTDSYGRRCLIARRLVERGVRFVQLFIAGQIWDNHNNLAAELRKACEQTDQPIAALVADLRQRGLLDSTLILWGGEFGRLPIAQLPGDGNEALAGRDHNKNAFTVWLAGGGVRGGSSLGATDDLGLAAVENPVSVADWHATIYHLLGLDYEDVYHERNGLRERLTGVKPARVVKEILA
ncbi:MAG: DUF1501 domain-containing protein [Pirellulales bacterium]|nr:DUF1501 domain-containing protein [Pirellulales bacterium]